MLTDVIRRLPSQPSDPRLLFSQQNPLLFPDLCENHAFCNGGSLSSRVGPGRRCLRLGLALGARPRIRRGRAHGACEASSRREEEAMSVHIVDGEQRRDRPQSPCALRVPAARGHLRRWRSSTMYRDIACVAPPCICPRGARNATPPNSRTGSWDSRRALQSRRSGNVGFHRRIRLHS